ncbi:hypothetical protein M9458_042104, partial [Cirrhinus mrigala]
SRWRACPALPWQGHYLWSGGLLPVPESPYFGGHWPAQPGSGLRLWPDLQGLNHLRAL